MKRFRHGPQGAAKPGLLDASGALRDRAGVIADITPATLRPDSMSRLATLDPATLPPVPVWALAGGARRAG
jgi:hypothetical protein